MPFRSRTTESAPKADSVPSLVKCILLATRALQEATANSRLAQEEELEAIKDLKHTMKMGVQPLDLDDEFSSSEYSAADDTSLSVPIRLACLLLESDTLDYQKASDRLWGPGVPFATAKNRISTNLAALRKMGIVTSIGGNRHIVDRSKLPITV